MRSVRRLAVSAVVTGALVLAVPSPSGAVEVSSTPTPSASFNASVLTVVHRGSTVYVGGGFTEATDSTGTYPRRHVAAFNANTGRLLPWHPFTNGRVYSIAAGKKAIFIGGDFTTVRGHSITNLAKVSPTGLGYARVKFHHAIDAPVHTVALSKKTVYAGGDFARVDGHKRLRLAAFERTGKYKLTNWRPRAAHALVAMIKVAKEGIYVGGKFTRINGRHKAQRLALLGKKKGHIVTTFNPPLIYGVFDFAFTKHRIYVAVGGPGGFVYSLIRKNGHEKWRKALDGDAQAIKILDKEVYVGGHFRGVCRTDATEPNGLCSDGSVVRRRLAAFHLRGGLTAWNPDGNSEFGVAALDRMPKRSRLLVGGTFTAFAGDTIPASRFAIFGP